MTLYLKARRKCENCEYYDASRYGNEGKCQFYPPVVSGEHQRGRFPATYKNSYCSKWEPKWSDNPVLQDAWKEFMLVHKLVTTEEEQ